MITVKTEQDLKKMRVACRITGEVLRMIEQYVVAGVTTKELDERIEQFIIEQGATPSFKHLYGFPASACISVDDEVVHGIPSERKLVEGQIVSIDVGACFGGYHGDAARTFAVGEVSEDKKRLIEITKQSFFEGIKQARIGRRVGDISSAVQKYVENNGFSVVRVMTGHGIGRKVHEEPNIPNFGTPNTGAIIKKGYTFAIEPMVNMGTHKVIIDQNDGWTCKTADGKMSAHYENTILITSDEPEILTL